MIRGLFRYAPLLIVAIAWEIAPRAGLISPDALPPFSDVVRAGVALMISGDLPTQGLSSLANLCAGLALGIVVGIVLGVGMAWFPLVEDIVGPLVKCLYPVPKSALIPIMIVWFGLGMVSKVASIFLGCLLPVVISTFNGVRGVDQTLVWSARAAGAREHEVLWDVAIPSAMPDILAGIRNALAISFILLVSSELLMGQQGIGFLISFLGDGGSYDGMFASVLTISIAGFLADRLYLALMKRALVWRE